MDILSAATFLDIWKGLSQNEPESSKYYQPDKTSNSNIIVSFNDVEIDGIIHAKDIQEQMLALRLSNCKIEALRIENCNTDFISILDRCEIKQFIIEKKSITRYLSIEDSTISCDLAIWSQAEVESIHFIKCKVNAIRIQDVESDAGDILIRDSEVNTISHQEGIIKSLTIENSNIKYIKFDQYSTVDFLEIESNSTIKRIELNSVFFKQYIKIKESAIKELFIHTLELPEITVWDCQIGDLTNKIIVPTTFSLKNSVLDSFISTEMRTGKDSLFQILDCKINCLKFESMINLSSFIISKLEPARLNQKSSKIYICNADLGKMMISSDLSLFDEFIFLDSKVVDIFIAGRKLPEKINTINEENLQINEGNLQIQKRLLYSQLKRVYDNLGDSITPLKYSHDEMEIYRNQIDDGVGLKKLPERFQLWFNYKTNKHGTDWLSSLKLTFLISFILYVFYCYLLFGFQVHGNIGKAINLIPYYFEFINPTHKIDFLKPFNVNKNSWRESLALVADTFVRILIPLLIFQMVQAFRKYGRR